MLRWFVARVRSRGFAVGRCGFRTVSRVLVFRLPPFLSETHTRNCGNVSVDASFEEMTAGDTKTKVTALRSESNPDGI